MDKFVRSDAPECLAKAAQEPELNWKKFNNRACYEQTRDALLKCSSDTCAFCAGGFAQSIETIEHFKPQSQFPEQTFIWGNLFPCCTACQSAKLQKWDDLLIKPDTQEYAPSDVFQIDFENGALLPLENEWQKLAEKSIEIYKLNRAPLKRERRSAAKQLLQGDAADLAQYRFLKDLVA